LIERREKQFVSSHFEKKSPAKAKKYQALEAVTLATQVNKMAGIGKQYRNVKVRQRKNK
jgi:hypothetical protein